MREINKIVIHCAATKPDMNIGVTEIRQWHLDRNFNDIGYHYIIRRNGDLELGRSTDIQGAHVRGHNEDSIGICLVGGMANDDSSDANYTRIQLRVLEALLQDLLATYDNVEIVGHRDLDPSKDCPCFDVKEWWYEGAVQQV